MKIPCPPKCPNRCATCHSTCQEYLDFVKENELRKKKKWQENTIDHDLAEIKKGCFR